jgi:long-chain acyl-CoA synthetase
MLRDRTPPGSVIMLSLPNCIEFPATFFAIIVSRNTVFPLWFDTGKSELLSHIRDSRAIALIGSPQACAAAAPHLQFTLSPSELPTLPPAQALPVPDHAPASGMLLCSSGTTGRPKIAFRDAHALDAVSRNMCQAIDFRPTDRVLSVIPLCHSYGVEHGLFAPIYAGSTTHLLPGLDLPLMLSELTDHAITILPASPSICEMMCQSSDARPLPHLRRAYTAGAPLPPSVSHAFHSLYGQRLGQVYGATEVGSVTFNDPDTPDFDPRSVGLPYEDVRIRVVDPETRAPLAPNATGEIHVSAPSMLHHYLNEPTLPAIDGYFATGDLGHLDEAGRLTITGRLKLLVDVGGLKVNLLEVEEALLQHETVAAAAVLPIRVSETVYRLKAVVTPNDPQRPPVPEELRRFLRERLTAYKVPRVIEVRLTLPRSPTGKILRHRLEAP